MTKSNKSKRKSLEESSISNKSGEVFKANLNNLDQMSPEVALFKNRTIVVTGEVNDGMADAFIKAITYLDGLDNEKPIIMIINSPGGSVSAGLAMYDAMREARCEVHTKVMGMAASMGSLLLCAGDKRYASKTATVMIHQPMGGIRQGAQQTEFDITGRYITDLRETLTQIYVDHSGLDHWEVDELLERDNWLTADQSVALGLVDEVIEHNPKKAPRWAGKKRSEVKRSADKKQDDMMEKIVANRKSMLATNDNKKVTKKRKSAPKRAR